MSNGIPIDTRETGATSTQVSPGIARSVRTLGGCHLAMSASISPAFFGVFSLFLKPIAEQTGWARSEIVLAVSIASLVCAICTPLAGILVDKIGAKIITFLAVVGLPLATVLFALSVPSWGLYIAAAFIVGVAGALSSPAGYVSILPKWFDRRLGLALAITMGGIGLGQILNVLMASYLIDIFGWRQGWVGWSCGVLCVALTGWLLVPWKTLASSSLPGQSNAHDAAMNEESDAAFLWRPLFWFLTFAFFLVLVVTAGVHINVAAALTDKGYNRDIATLAVAIMGASSMGARLIGGFLLDIVSARSLSTVIFLVQGVGCLLLIYSPNPIVALIAAFLIAFAFGVEADVLPYIVRRKFGMKNYGRKYGVMFGVVQLGMVISPPLVAMFYDSMGTYDPAFYGLFGCSVIAAAIVFVALKPKTT